MRLIGLTLPPISRNSLIPCLALCALLAPVSYSPSFAQYNDRRTIERNKQQVALMIKALSHDDAQRRANAAHMLGQSAHIPATAKAIPALKKAMLNDSAHLVTNLCAKAYWLLTGDSNDAVPILLKGLENKSSAVRLHASRAFIEVGTDGKRAIPLLKKLVHDKNVRIREAAIRALEAKGPWAKTAASDLVKALADEEYKNSNESLNSVFAARALKEIGLASEEVRKGLIKALDSKDSNTQVQAALTLGSV